MEQYKQPTQRVDTVDTQARLDMPSTRDYYRLLEQLERQGRAIRRLEGELSQLRDQVRSRQ